MKKLEMLCGGVAVLSMCLLAFWLLREGFRMVHYALFDCAGYPWMAGNIGASGVVMCAAGVCIAFCTCIAAVVAQDS